MCHPVVVLQAQASALPPPSSLTAFAAPGMVGVPSGVPGAEAAELMEAEVVVTGEAERAIIFWRTSRILSCRHTLLGKASECFSWNADVACEDQFQSFRISKLSLIVCLLIHVANGRVDCPFD